MFTHAPILVCLACLGLGVAVSAQESMRDVREDGWQSKYLTRDATDTWKFAGAENTVVRAWVETKEFDPVLKLVHVTEDAETILESRDDEGGRSCLVHRLPAEGRYEVRVHAFEQKGGGNYRLHLTRFAGRRLVVGEPASGQFPEEGQTGFWFTAGVGDTLTFQHHGPVKSWHFFAPDGRDAEQWCNAFTILEEGEYFVLLRGTRHAHFEVSTDLAIRAAMPESTASDLALPANSMRVFEFEGNKDDFRVIRMRHDRPVATRLVRLVREKKGKCVRLETDGFRALPVASKGGEFRSAFVLQDAGQYQFQVLSTAPHGGTLEIGTKDPSIPIAFGKAARHRIAVGDAHFYSFAVKPGQYFTIDLASGAFDPLVRLTDGEGKAIATDDNGGRRLASRIRLLSRDTGTYRIQVASSGDGGGGEYELRLTDVAIPAIRVGERRPTTVTQGSLTYWHLRAREGEEFILSVKSDVVDTKIEVMGPSGVTLKRGARGGVGGNALMAVRMPRDGVYTIGVGSQSGSGRCELRVIDG